MRSKIFRRIAIGLLCSFLPLAAIAGKSFSDFPFLDGLERTTIASKSGNRLDVIYYKSQQRLPALVIIPGSLCSPIFASVGNGEAAKAFATATLFSQEQRNKLNSHIVYLERRNIVSLETMSSAPEFTIEQIFKLSPCTHKNGGVTLEERFEDTSAQLRWLKKQPWVGSIHLVGLSEGSDVAARLLGTDHKLADSIMIIGGAGPSQFSDNVTSARAKGNAESIKKAFSDFDSFLSSPPSRYQGYSSERWISFAVENTVLDSLLGSNTPLFIAHGAKDENVPIASADFAVIELMRKQPSRPIFYWSVANGDHMLKTPDKGRIQEIIAAYLNWATSKPSGRAFKVD